MYLFFMKGETSDPYYFRLVDKLYSLEDIKTFRRELLTAGQNMYVDSNANNWLLYVGDIATPAKEIPLTNPILFEYPREGGKYVDKVLYEISVPMTVEQRELFSITIYERIGSFELVDLDT